MGINAGNRDNLRQFDDTGCALLRQVIPADVLQPIRQLVEAEVDKRICHYHNQGLITDLHENAPFEKRLALAYKGSELDERKWSDFLFTPAMHRLATHPDIIANLAPILGSDIMFHGDFQLVAKLPGSEWTAFPWHQDTWYYGEPSRHMLIITVWLPLVETTIENGCLWVIPGSHRWGLLPAIRGDNSNVQTYEDVEQKGEACPVPMRPGDILLLTNMTFHSSRMNNSDGVRWSMDLGYSSKPDPENLFTLERRSYQYMYQTLKRGGRTPLQVSGSGNRYPETFRQWQDRAALQGN